MIKIQKASGLTGAQRFGQCLSCGVGSQEADIYQIQYALPNSTRDVSTRLCRKCLIILKTMIDSIDDVTN